MTLTKNKTYLGWTITHGTQWLAIFYKESDADLFIRWHDPEPTHGDVVYAGKVEINAND